MDITVWSTQSCLTSSTSFLLTCICKLVINWITVWKFKLLILDWITEHHLIGIASSRISARLVTGSSETLCKLEENCSVSKSLNAYVSSKCLIQVSILASKAKRSVSLISFLITLFSVLRNFDTAGFDSKLSLISDTNLSISIDTWVIISSASSSDRIEAASLYLSQLSTAFKTWIIIFSSSADQLHISRYSVFRCCKRQITFSKKEDNISFLVSASTFWFVKTISELGPLRQCFISSSVRVSFVPNFCENISFDGRKHCTISFIFAPFMYGWLLKHSKIFPSDLRNSSDV